MYTDTGVSYGGALVVCLGCCSGTVVVRKVTANKRLVKYVGTSHTSWYFNEIQSGSLTNVNWSLEISRFSAL